MFSVLSLFLLLCFVYLSVYYAGGLGFVYGLMGLISYQLIAAVIQGSGAVASSAFRLSKLVGF
jgi:hypothetical protein